MIYEMEQNRIENFLNKRGADPKQTVKRDNGGQYLKNLLLEFAAFVRDETLIEVQRDVKKLRGK